MMAVRALVLALASAVAAAGIAAAAGTGVTAERMTVFTSTDQLPTVTCTLTADADAYVDEASTLLGSNFGSSSELRVQSLSLADRRTLLVFGLGACGIPSTATVLSARLRLTLTQAPASSRAYDLHQVGEDWTETGVTWSNQPAVASSATASAATGTTPGAVIEFDAASDVSRFVAGTATNRGWRLRDSAEDAVLAGSSRFAAREHTTASSRPTLIVRYQR